MSGVKGAMVIGGNVVGAVRPWATISIRIGSGGGFWRP